ncbi:MAG: ATP-dependent RNA helicase HrpA, partial [Chitinispirillia bacterium]
MKNNKKSILPIHSKKTEILKLLKENQVLIVAGETGSGKTTQLPQFCLDAGFGKTGYIVCTQPRRIAATSTAQRVAEERNTVLGTEVGFRVRFHEKYSGQTRIYFMTDGILLNEIISDGHLSKYQTIIIDEAHERSLNIDFLIGYIKIILTKRPDLKLIISSATIDVSLFSKAFNNAPVVEVSGRLFPVEVIYQPLDLNDLETGNFTYVDAAAQTVKDLVELGDPGDILVFMPTERDIIETVKLLTGKKLYSSLILPLFARLTRFQQNRIFYPSNERKIIISTNIAETSITVPGIRFVIDTGLARISRFVPRSRTNRLPIEPVSQASSDQRKGRCGRIEDGLCFRLYSEEDYFSRRKFNTPEIKRSNIAGVILNMINIKLGDIEDFPFLEPPDKRAIKDGFDQLIELGAINPKKQLTSLGEKMVRLPLEPHISRMIVQAYKENAQREILIISAGLSIGDPRERPEEKIEEAKKIQKQFNASDSDFLTLLRLWDAYQNQWKSLKTQNKMRRFCRDHFLSYNRMNEWNDIYRQIIKILKEVRFLKLNSKSAHIDSIHRSVLCGIISNIALKKEKTSSYTATKNREIYIFPGSILFKKSPQWIMCHEIVETSRVFGRNVAPISPQWIEELAPSLCRSTYSEPFYDPETMYVRVYETVYFFGLPIISKRKT